MTDASHDSGTVRKTSSVTGIPVPARAFVRCGSVKVFGGFVLAVPEIVEPDDVDEVWEIEITFKRKLSKGRGATGLRLDQAMTDSFLAHPESLEREPR